MFRIFIGDLKKNVNKSQLNKLLSEIDSFSNLALVQSRKGTKNAFIDVGEAALESFLLHPLKIKGREHYCQISQKVDVPDHPIFTKRVYVNKIPKSLTDEELASIFGKFGTVLSAFSVKTTKFANKGYGFVFFEDYETARKVAEMRTVRTKKGQLCVSEYRHKTKLAKRNYAANHKPLIGRTKFQVGRERNVQNEVSLSPVLSSKKSPIEKRRARLRTTHQLQNSNQPATPAEGNRNPKLEFEPRGVKDFERARDLLRISRCVNFHRNSNLRFRVSALRFSKWC
jgi:RNA recognition motif-containing protein